MAWADKNEGLDENRDFHRFFFLGGGESMLGLAVKIN